MKEEMRPDALIFDLDGTLWDAVETYTRSWNDYFEQCGIQKSFTPDFLDQFMGWEPDAYLGAVLPEFARGDRGLIYEEVIALQYKNIIEHGGKLYDGVSKGLQQLSGKYKLFIVSNCAKHTITHFLTWAGIGHLITDSMAFGTNYQPKHSNIRRLIEKHKLERAVYIGDTKSDGEHSELASVPFVFVSYGFGTADHYDLKFDSFNELTSYYLSNNHD